MKNINERSQELIKSAYNKTTIKMMLKAEGYSKLDIDKLDIPSHKSETIDEFAIMKIIIANETKSRKEIAELLSDKKLCSFKTAQHILSLMKFCKAYHELIK